MLHARKEDIKIVYMPQAIKKFIKTIYRVNFSVF